MTFCQDGAGFGEEAGCWISGVDDEYGLGKGEGCRDGETEEEGVPSSSSSSSSLGSTSLVGSGDDPNGSMVGRRVSLGKSDQGSVDGELALEEAILVGVMVGPVS